MLYPHLLWVTLCITLFKSPENRTTAGLPDFARKLTRSCIDNIEKFVVYLLKPIFLMARLHVKNSLWKRTSSQKLPMIYVRYPVDNNVHNLQYPHGGWLCRTCLEIDHTGARLAWSQ